MRTPNGTLVPVLVITGREVSPAAKARERARIAAKFPGARIVGDATIKYNCHAFALAGRKNVWMNDPSVYWNDGSYRLITSNSPSAVGQKAYHPVSVKFYGR